MSPRNASLKKRTHLWVKRHSRQLVTMAIVALIGAAATLSLRAAASTASIEAEAGARTGAITEVGDSTASGMKGVKFGNTSGLPAPNWSDEFNGTSLSFATDNGGGTWRTKGYEAGNDLANGYEDWPGDNWNSTPDQVQRFGLANVAGGILTLKAKRVNTLTNPGNTGGRQWAGVYLVSNHKTNLVWRYGYFEWRMRNPNPVRGMFPTMWMFNNKENRHDGYEGAELDMIEVFGDPRGYPWYSGIHFNPSRLNGMEGFNVATTYTETSNWHRYSIHWTRDSIVYARDGQTLRTIGGAEAEWYSHADLGLRMNYAMDPENIPDSPRSTPTDPPPGTEPRMEIDYVRVYNQKPANLPGGTEDPYK